MKKNTSKYSDVHVTVFFFFKWGNQNKIRKKDKWRKGLKKYLLKAIRPRCPRFQSNVLVFPKSQSSVSMSELPVETQSVWPPSSTEHTLWDGGGLTVPDEDVIQLSAEIKDQRLTTTVICQVETGRKDPHPQAFGAALGGLNLNTGCSMRALVDPSSLDLPVWWREQVLGSFGFSSTPALHLDQHLQRAQAGQFSHGSSLVPFFWFFFNFKDALNWLLVNLQRLPFWPLGQELWRDIQQAILPMPLGKTQIQKRECVRQIWNHITGFNWKHASLRILTLLQIILVGQTSDFITPASACLPVIAGEFSPKL